MSRSDLLLCRQILRVTKRKHLSHQRKQTIRALLQGITVIIKGNTLPR
jgi:hypothetical protein